MSMLIGRFVRVLELASSAGAKGVGWIRAAVGAVLRSVESKLTDTVSVLDFGAVLDGVADDTLALQKALDHCETSGAQLIGAPGVARITATLHIRCSCDLAMMRVNVNGTAVSVAIVVGRQTNAYIENLRVHLPVIVNTAKAGAGWVGFTSAIGLQIGTLYSSRVYSQLIYGFGIGMDVGGWGSGCVHNEIFVGTLSGNMVNQRLLPKLYSAAHGWCNDNLFIGGKYQFASGEGVAVAGTRHLLVQRDPASTVGAPNNNVWHKPSVEGNVPEFHLDIQGAFNKISSPRLENDTGIPVRVRFYSLTEAETTANQIEDGYDLGITYTFAGLSSPNNGRWGAKGNCALDFSGNGLNLVNRTGSSVASPHVQGFESSVTPLGKTEAAADWIYRLHGAGLSIKGAANAAARIDLSSSGFLGLGSGGSAPLAGFAAGVGAELRVTGELQPATSGAYSLGASSLRWSTVYAVTGTINTSDERAKQDIAPIDERVLRAWSRVRFVQYKMRDAVAAKGAAARLHAGVIAQEVQAAFASEGLDAFAYGLLCHDTWIAQPEQVDQDGKVVQPAIPAGDAWGVRYEEALAIECAYLRSRLA